MGTLVSRLGAFLSSSSHNSVKFLRFPNISSQNLRSRFFYQTKHNSFRNLVSELNNTYTKLCTFLGHPVQNICQTFLAKRPPPCIMCVQCIGGISWVHRGLFSTSGDIMSTSGDIISTSGGISWVHRGWYHEYIGVFSRNWKTFIDLLPHMRHDIAPMYYTSPDVFMISPRRTHDIPPMYSWYPADVLMVSPRCTEHPPTYSWYTPMYSWYPPDVLNTLPCTEHPPMYWIHIIQGDLCSFSITKHWNLYIEYLLARIDKLHWRREK